MTRRTHEDDLMAEIDYTIPDEQVTITVGELRRTFADFPDDFPVTIMLPSTHWMNVDGATKGEGENSIILVARDDFDTRQW